MAGQPPNGKIPLDTVYRPAIMARMTLAEYLEAEGLKPTQFAQALGAEPSTVTRMVHGERGPSLDMALRIEAATDGKVTVRDWPSRLPLAAASGAET